MANWGTYEYVYLWLPGIEAAEETVTASHYVSALLIFPPHPICLPLEGKMPLAADEV